MPEEIFDPIRLEKNERKLLLAASRKYTAPYCDVMRAKAILLAADGLSNRQIEDRLELPGRIVAKWRKRFFQRRLASLRQSPGAQPLAGSKETFPQQSD